MFKLTTIFLFALLVSVTFMCSNSSDNGKKAEDFYNQLDTKIEKEMVKTDESAFDEKEKDIKEENEKEGNDMTKSDELGENSEDGEEIEDVKETQEEEYTEVVAGDTNIDAAGEGKEISVSSMTIKYKIAGDNLNVTMIAPTTGWVSIGIGATKKMKGANIIIGYVKDGITYVEDHYGNSESSHLNDTNLGGSDDIIEFSGTEENGTTTITFTIPLDSGDSYDVVLKPGNSYKCIVAFGQDGADDTTSFHKKVGGFTLNL